MQQPEQLVKSHPPPPPPSPPPVHAPLEVHVCPAPHATQIFPFAPHAVAVCFETAMHLSSPVQHPEHVSALHLRVSVGPQDATTAVNPANAIAMARRVERGLCESCITNMLSHALLLRWRA